MPKLTSAQIGQLEARLVARESELNAEIAAARDTTRQQDAARGRHVIDRKEDADEDAAAEVAEAEVERDLGELKAIQAARLRIHAGLYGQCLDCEEPIPYARLDAQPAAVRCATCQSGFEEKMSHRH